MPVIYCKINMFDAEQKIYIVDDGQPQEVTSVDLKHLDGTIAALCYERNIYNVHLFGLRDFIIDVKKAINMTENLMFSQNRIEVEVN